jgi:hypothetical protein
LAWFDVLTSVVVGNPKRRVGPAWRSVLELGIGKDFPLAMSAAQAEDFANELEAQLRLSLAGE